jgi:molybdopterin-guanine dinucleotide biosynthesis adapter protein
VKVFGFAGQSGSGKTTVIENLIPLFSSMSLTVSVIKHTHHSFDVDSPGKDSWRQRHAGAKEVLLTSDIRWALMHELRGAPEPELPEQLRHLSSCDLVLVAGFKRQPIPRLEVWRLANNSPPLYPTDPNIVAVATDAKLDIALPIFALDDYRSVALFILRSARLADALFLTSSDNA